VQINQLMIIQAMPSGSIRERSITTFTGGLELKLAHVLWSAEAEP
jgi:hypothetical protein